MVKTKRGLSVANKKMYPLSPLKGPVSRVPCGVFSIEGLKVICWGLGLLIERAVSEAFFRTVRLVGLHPY